jgi:hypothetical protein
LRTENSNKCRNPSKQQPKLSKHRIQSDNPNLHPKINTNFAHPNVFDDFTIDRATRRRIQSAPPLQPHAGGFQGGANGGDIRAGDGRQAVDAFSPPDGGDLELRPFCERFRTPPNEASRSPDLSACDHFPIS